MGSSIDTWGTKLNTDLATLDALFATTGTGTVIVRDSSNRANTTGVLINKAAGNARTIDFQSAGSERWLLGANATAESGSNAGSDWNLNAYSDTGVLLSTPITVTRATGLVAFSTTPEVGTNLIYHTGNDAPITPGIGEVRHWLGTADPNANWMVMDGRAISRTTYATLFALIGTLYGAGNGTTTFNIPDARERVFVGKAATKVAFAGSAYDPTVLGASFGEALHTLTAAESAVLSYTTTISNQTEIMLTNGTNTAPSTGGSVDFANSAGTTATTTSNAGGGAHNNVQPSLVIQHILRVL